LSGDVIRIESNKEIGAFSHRYRTVLQVVMAEWLRVLLRDHFLTQLKEPLPYLAVSGKLECLPSSLGTKGSEHSLR